MNKEEILAMSRRENSDDGIEYAMSKGRKIGETAMFIMALALMLFNGWQGQDNNQVIAMYMTFSGFALYGRYQVTRQKIFLLCAIVGLSLGVLFTAGYLISVLR